MREGIPHPRNEAVEDTVWSVESDTRPIFFWARGKSSNNACGSVWSSSRLNKNPARSLNCPGCRPTVDPLSGPFSADSSLRRAWNTTRRRHGLSPDWTASFPLLAAHKPAPTVAEDRRLTSVAPGVSYGGTHTPLRLLQAEATHEGFQTRSKQRHLQSNPSTK